MSVSFFIRGVQMIIYVAGPYNGKDPLDVKQHILNASKVSIECWKRGWACICPHKNSSGFESYEDDKLTWETWINGDLEILAKCDAIVMVDDWHESKGALIELEFAKEKGIIIFMSIDDVPNLDNNQENADFNF